MAAWSMVRDPIGSLGVSSCPAAWCVSADGLQGLVLEFSRIKLLFELLTQQLEANRQGWKDNVIYD